MKTLISNIRLKSEEGYKQLDVYNVDTFPYDYFLFNKPKVLKKWKNKQVYEYLDIIASFDTENTSYYDSKSEHWKSLTYLWGFCIDGFTIVGRNMEQFLEFIKRLHNTLNLGKKKLVVYVHNLSYDFTFIYKFLKDLDPEADLFATDSRKILTFNAYGIEFRCSYRLFNMSLEQAVKNEKGTIYRKAKGDLNYKKFRTPRTPLTSKEWNYFILDLVSLYDLIKNKLENESSNIKDIQLTSTGFVRYDMRDNCIGYGHSKKTKEQKEYKKMFKKLGLSKQDYIMLEFCKAGGDTHGNRNYVSDIIDSLIFGDIHSGDLQSSYPAVMLLEDEYPISSYMPYGEVESEEEFKKLLKKYACLFFIEFNHIKIKKDNPFDCISLSKIVKKDDTKVINEDNGRLIEGQSIRLCCNQVDVKLIFRNYDFDDYKISAMRIADKGPLPELVRKTIFSYFEKKCKLKMDIKRYEKENEGRNYKNDEEYKDLLYRYAKFKNLINACFGLMLTNPVKDTAFINEDDEWYVKKADIEEELTKYYNSHKSFLHYAWGVMVTSLARLALDNMRRACIGKFGTALYWDTDSCKGFNFDFESINRYNQKQRNKVMKKGYLVTIDGREFVIGDIEIETEGNPYKKFVTLGAKKYAYEDKDGLHITISGVKKEPGAKEMGNINKFTHKYIFKHSAGQVAYYDDSDIHYEEIDGYKFLTASGVALYDSTYELHAPDYWLDYLHSFGEMIYD